VCGDASELFSSKQSGHSTSKASNKAKAGNNKSDKNILFLPEPSKTTVLLDPPRKGCSKEFLSAMLSYRPNTIVYVSCDPTSQARDAEIICDFQWSSSPSKQSFWSKESKESSVTTEGPKFRYEIVDITPFDMFPQTKHVENIMVFRLVSS
jgi:tRNA (uracil-5-)-methyltransferase